MNVRRELKIWINDQQVGTLASQDDIWQFQYSPDWLSHEKCFALAPVFELCAKAWVDGSDTRPVQWYFDNLLPEEQLRSALAQEAHIAEADAFGLLAYYGAESAGALVLDTGKALLEFGPYHSIPVIPAKAHCCPERLVRRVDLAISTVFSSQTAVIPA